MGGKRRGDDDERNRKNDEEDTPEFHMIDICIDPVSPDNYATPEDTA